MTAKKTSTSPLTIIVSKPNTAPTLSILNSEQQTFDVSLSSNKPAFVPVGKPVDVEGDNFSLSFDNKG